MSTTHYCDDHYVISPWLPRVMRLLAVGFLMFFSGALIAVLFHLDQFLLNSDTGLFVMRLVRWGDLRGGGKHYELMISIIYVVWGIFLWRAAANPLQNKLFLDFTVAANVAHFGLMFLQGFLMHGEHIHLVGDVLLGWVGLIFLVIFWLPARAHAH